MLIYKLVACSAMLLYASHRDLRSREVPDKLWLVFGAVGAILMVNDYVSGSADLAQLLLPPALTVALSVGLYRFGLFGGADAKALMALSLILPTYQPANYLHPLTSFMVLANASSMALTISLYFASRNLLRIARGERIFEGFEGEKIWRKALACFVGYRVKGEPKPFLLRLERGGHGKRRLDFSLLKEADEFVHERDIWVTPGMPFLVFITAGFFLMLFYGDVLTFLLKGFLRP